MREKNMGRKVKPMIISYVLWKNVVIFAAESSLGF
jgi:hypothetical protein